jgi:hypothetical protein
MAAPQATPEGARLSYPERQWRAALTLGWPLVLGGAPLLVALGDVPLCAFRQITGRPCPLCGGTHVCAALVEGNFLAAWQANPGLFPLLVIAAVQTVQLTHEAWRAKPLKRWRIGQGVWGAGVAFLVVVWMLRLLPGLV